jgi:hypothetical protein
MVVLNNVIITTANSPYYYSLLTLINGIHQYGLDCVDKIYVYNLGLSGSEIETLNKLKLVEVLDYPEDVMNKHSKFMGPKSHVYKLFCLYKSGELGKNVFWLDAGATPINPMCEIFSIIENEDVFTVGDTHLTKTYTHSNCVNVMSATENELNGTILSSGIIGYKSNGKYQKMFKEAFDFSLVEGCVDGDQENHRHDQSVLSILCNRYGCKKHDIDKYGYWTDINRNLNTALQNNTIIFVHRKGYINTENLIYET